MLYCHINWNFYWMSLMHPIPQDTCKHLEKGVWSLDLCQCAQSRHRRFSSHSRKSTHLWARGCFEEHASAEDFAVLFSATVQLGSSERLPQPGWKEGPVKPVQLCWMQSPQAKSQTVCPFYDLTLPLLETCLLRSFYHLSAICQRFAADLFPNEIELHFWTQRSCSITLFI